VKLFSSSFVKVVIAFVSFIAAVYVYLTETGTIKR